MAVSTGPLSSEVIKSFRNGDVLPAAVEWNRKAVVDRDAVADKTLDKNMLWLCETSRIPSNVEPSTPCRCVTESNIRYQWNKR